MAHDLDLDLDLSHLDDPDPPAFGPVWAGEATRRSAEQRARRARTVAVAVVAVSLLAGVGAVTRGGDDDVQQATGAPTTIPAPPPDDTTFVPTTAPGLIGEPGSTLPGAPAVAVPEPLPPVTSTTTPAAAAGGPVTPTVPAAPAATAGATVPGPVVATGQPPAGTGPAPADIRFTLTLDAQRVAAGGSVGAHIRFENHRATPVTLVGGGCSTLWRAALYDAGRAVTGGETVCPMAIRIVVPAGGVETATVTVQPDPQLRPGTYDAFTTVRVEEIGAALHTDRRVVEVFRS